MMFKSNKYHAYTNNTNSCQYFLPKVPDKPILLLYAVPFGLVRSKLVGQF